MTVKGYGLGPWGESKNIAHNIKNVSLKHLMQWLVNYMEVYAKFPATKKK